MLDIELLHLEIIHGKDAADWTVVANCQREIGFLHTDTKSVFSLDVLRGLQEIHKKF